MRIVIFLTIICGKCLRFKHTGYTAQSLSPRFVWFCVIVKRDLATNVDLWYAVFYNVRNHDSGFHCWKPKLFQGACWLFTKI